MKGACMLSQYVVPEGLQLRGVTANSRGLPVKRKSVGKFVTRLRLSVVPGLKWHGDILHHAFRGGDKKLCMVMAKLPGGNGSSAI